MSAERKRKKDGSVSEEAHGSWGSLITVMAAGETRGMKDTRDGVQQTWQESLSRDEMNQPIQQPSLLLLIWGCDITSSPRRSADGAGSRCSRSVLVKKKKKKGGEVNASRSDIWIELWITASRAAPRGSEYLMKSYVWWKCLESRGRGSFSDPMFTCTDTEITDQSG